MTGDAVTAGVVRLPVTVRRVASQPPSWRAELPLPGDRVGLSAPYHAESGTRQQACRELGGLLAQTLDLVRQQPVLVIGGDAQYANHLHLINPEPGGWVVYVIRQGRVAATWHSDHDRVEQLRQVLAHVGGQPTVVTL